MGYKCQPGLNGNREPYQGMGFQSQSLPFKEKITCISLGNHTSLTFPSRGNWWGTGLLFHTHTHTQTSILLARLFLMSSATHTEIDCAMLWWLRSACYSGRPRSLHTMEVGFSPRDGAWLRLVMKLAFVSRMKMLGMEKRGLAPRSRDFAKGKVVSRHAQLYLWVNENIRNKLAFSLWLYNYPLCTDRSRTVWNVSPIRDWSLCHLFQA